MNKEELEEISRKLIGRYRADPGMVSKQYSNAYHDGIVIMSKAWVEELSKLQYKGLE